MAALSLTSGSSILGNVLIMAEIISIITLLEIQFKGRKFDGIQLITFISILLFFPLLFDVEPIPLVLAILLIKPLTMQ